MPLQLAERGDNGRYPVGDPCLDLLCWYVLERFDNTKVMHNISVRVRRHLHLKKPKVEVECLFWCKDGYIYIRFCWFLFCETKLCLQDNFLYNTRFVDLSHSSLLLKYFRKVVTYLC